MKPIIRVENVSKLYRIGNREVAYDTLRESIVEALRAPFGRLRGRNGKRNYETLWELKDNNFEIAPGEVVGVIGRNGAGKSTLMKVLSRITEPTTGRAELYGRVASLLVYALTDPVWRPLFGPRTAALIQLVSPVVFIAALGGVSRASVWRPTQSTMCCSPTSIPTTPWASPTPPATRCFPTPN